LAGGAQAPSVLWKAFDVLGAFRYLEKLPPRRVGSPCRP
jgi:hypothetical protein